MNKPLLSIIIPTIRYTNMLDQAIKSALDVDKKDIQIIVSVNSLDNLYKNSKYFSSKSIIWIFHPNPIVKMHDSWNFAIDKADGNHIFILSDDDLINKNLIENLFDKYVEDDVLILNRTSIFNQNGEIVSKQPKWSKTEYNKKEMFDYFLRNKITHHVGTFIFPKKLWKYVDGYKASPYPNSYYVDTVFHGLLISHSKKTITNNLIGINRRVHQKQASSKFYFRFQKINNYFLIIVDQLFSNKNFSMLMKEFQISKKKYYKMMLFDRFIIETNKLGNKTYNTKKINYLILLLNVFKWDMDLKKEDIF